MDEKQKEYVAFLEEYYPHLAEPVRGFFHLLKREGIDIIQSEKTVYHPYHEYAGTLDFAYERDMELGIGDIKTGQTGFETEMQLEAYAEAYEENTGERPTRVAIFKYRKDLKTPKWEFIQRWRDSTYYASFLHAQELFLASKAYKRRA
jgi:hypothetical protein